MTIEKKAGRGGKRKGAGRKSKWLPGTELKTMRLPACLEKELFDYAQRRIAELDYQPPAKAQNFSPTIAKSTVPKINPTPPSNKKTIVVELSLRVENNSKFVRRKKKVRNNIEYWCLSHYDYRKPFKEDKGFYELTISYETEDELERIIDDICREMFITADDDFCFVEFTFKEKGADRYWY
ncbi:hypothetical protein I4641_19160 [Waterburya agarophytonicola K14]|uniref:Uncharacterized protein n=1 Tax=Waterburya agarophytonicola KI4 TaxID=2874699 RepID=A0A964BUK9_9CYAN|nr:hypothetical protein [Waterburya agarophytonicola]MCC0179091.1 hypothetical protein [Waterburya agarophytonicola KI4]